MAWGNTNQKVVNAIRRITTVQAILVSGTQFARLVNWLSSSIQGIGPGLIQDPANNTIYDFHQYFDDDGGSYGLCNPWYSFVSAFEDVTSVLRNHGYRGIMTEFGGGPFSQCATLYEHLLSFWDENSDVWFGWTAWSSPPNLFLSPEKNSVWYTLTAVLEKYAPKKVVT